MPLFGPPNIEKLKARRDVKGLIKALRDKDWKIGQQAAQALGELRDPRAVDALTQEVKRNRQYVTSAAVDALVKIGDPRAIAPLVAALKNLGSEAATALDKFGWQPGADESGARYWAFKHNWTKCLQIGQPAIGVIIEELSSLDMDTRRQAAMTLGEAGDLRAVESLIIAFASNFRDGRDVLARQAAATALGKLGHYSAVYPLINALKDPHADIRRAAARALVSMYHGQTLAEDVRREILAVRPIIENRGTYEHVDRRISYGAHEDLGHHDRTTSCGGHEDSHTDKSSIGVDFPL